MIKTKTKLTQIVIIVLLALIMMTGGIVFLCQEVATPPAQIEENVDEVQADNGHNNIRWITYGASGKIGGAVSGYVTSGYKGDQNYKGHYNKSPNNLVGTEDYPLPAIRGQKYRGFKFTSNFNNLNTGLEHGYVKVMSDGVTYTEGSTNGINGYYGERGGIGFAATVTWDVHVYWVVRYAINWTVYPDNYNGYHYDANSFTYRYETVSNSGKWWWSADGTTETGTPYAPTRKGYTFGGFRTSRTSSAPMIINTSMKWTGYWNAGSAYYTTLYDYWEANTIKLTLNKNGGSGGTDYVWYKYNTNKFYSDSACTNQITSITRPTRAGYTFKGYQGDGTCGGNPNESYIAYSNTEFASDLCSDIYKNATLNAVWEANTIKLTLNKNGGSGGTDYVWYKYNTNKFYSDSACTNQITSITRPTRAGYTFKGYQGDGTCGGNPNENYIAYDSTEFAADLCSDIYKNATLNAVWTANHYTITADANGGTNAAKDGWTLASDKKTSTMSFTYGQAASAMPIASRTGHTCSGWYTSASGGTKVANADGTFIASISGYTDASKNWVRASATTLYAHWTVNNYTVTWNGNGASLDAKLWSYAGSTGYTSSNSGSNSSYTYSGKSASSSVTYDVAISYKTPIPFKLGNTFNGWWTSASGGYMVANTNGQVVASVSGYTDANKRWIRAQATTLYAQWTQQSYSISYNLNGGSLSSQPNSYTFGTAKAIGNPTRTGHTFAGWTVTSTLTNKAYATINLSSGVMEFSNSYPTAVYFPLFYQRANVSYSGKGSDQNGEIRWRQYSTGGAYLGSNSGSSSADCMTSLWYHGGMNSATTTITWSQAIGYTIPSNQTGNLTLVAKWTINSYKLTAKANSGSIPTTSGWTGSGAEATKMYVYDTAYGTLPVPTKTGYGFAGWWTQASGGTQVSATTKMGAADTTIYAHWTISSYTLTADCYGGTAPSILPGEWTANGQKPYLTLYYQSEYGTLPEPTRQGYIFVGWFTAASGGSEVNSSTKMGAANATIYARWVESWVKYMSDDNPVIDQADGYYKIDSAEKLARLAYLVNYNIDNGKWASYKYKQTADINLSAHYWQPIGNETHPFKGTYDGTTFDIHNMKTYCGANDYEAYNRVGMFGYISGATIKNVNNYDVNIKGRQRTGAIAGRDVSSTIQNCKVTGSVTGTAGYIGGLVGASYKEKVIECENKATVKGDFDVGGIVGNANETAITNCVNLGTIQGRNATGGIAGYKHYDSVVNCINSGNVTGSGQYIGGIVGSYAGAKVQNSINEGTIQGTTMVGGIVGYMHTGAATILNGLNTGTLKATAANSEVGGIAGRVTYATTITSSFVDCSITPVSTSKVGVIVGNTTVATTITYCGAKVNVTAAASTVQSFYNAASGVKVTCNDSYSLVNNNRTQVNRITATNSGMDGKFSRLPTIHDGLPVPLGIYHTSQYGTTTGIASTLKGSQYGCTTA